MRTLCPELAVVSICPDCVKSLLRLMTADERLFGQKMQTSVICAAWEPSCGGQELNVWDVRMARIIHQPQLSRYQLYPPLPQTSPTKYLEIRNNTNIIRTELVGSTGCKYLLCLRSIWISIATELIMHACLAWTYELKMILDQAFKAFIHSPKAICRNFWWYSFLFFSFCCCVFDDIFLWLWPFC